MSGVVYKIVSHSGKHVATLGPDNQMTFHDKDFARRVERILPFSVPLYKRELYHSQVMVKPGDFGFTATFLEEFVDNGYHTAEKVNEQRPKMNGQQACAHVTQYPNRAASPEIRV